jgi:hypothetical protein
MQGNQAVSQDHDSISHATIPEIAQGAVQVYKRADEVGKGGICWRAVKKKKKATQ